MLYIQSEQAQDIANKIHYTNMVNQYYYFIDKPDSQGEIITKERIQSIWGASKLFLECTQEEAIDQYSLVGISSTTYIPVVEPLQGTTNAYDNPKTINKYDYTNIDENEMPEVIDTYHNCILYPNNIENYDLSEFEYEVIEVINITE